MRVKATAVGFYGQLRDINEEFDIAGKQELGSWMVEVPAKAAKPAGKSQPKAEDEPQGLPDA